METNLDAAGVGVTQLDEGLAIRPAVGQDDPVLAAAASAQPMREQGAVFGVERAGEVRPVGEHAAVFDDGRRLGEATITIASGP